MQLDFTRQTQRCGPCRYPRSRKIPKLTSCTVTVIYRYTLPGSSQQLLSTGVISLDYVRPKDNIMDPLTKRLNKELVEKHRGEWD